MLKSLLSLLLSKFYSKKESSLVAHQAMPQDGGTTISTTTAAVGSDWVSVADFTAPTDGYCMARIRPSAMFGFLQISAANGTMSSVIATNTANEGQWVHQSLPIRKGASVKVQVSNGDNILVKFFSTIGGGGYEVLEELILQGGVQCLKVWYSFLRKSSFSVKRNGSDIRAPQRLEEPQTQLLQLHLQEIGKILLRRLMVTFGSAAFPQKSFWTMAVFGKVWRTTFITTKALLSLSQKGQPSGTTSMLTVKDFTLGLKRATLLSSTLGGASC